MTTHLTFPTQDVTLAASLYGDAQAPAVLMLHGISQCRDAFDELARSLEGRFAVYTLDFRGHGHSGRASRYRILDYVSDAAAALAAIGRPVVAIGHSLGGVVAGILSQRAHPMLRAAFLIDPPWYFGEPAEYARTAFPARFALLIGVMTTLKGRGAPVSAYAEVLAKSPHPAGGTVEEHALPRHILSHASALHRMDMACWQHEIPELFEGVDTGVPFARPTAVLRADDRLGAALLSDHAARLQATNPGLELIDYDGSDHLPHRHRRFHARLERDMTAFVERHASV